MISLHDDKCLAFVAGLWGRGTRCTISACIMGTFAGFSVKVFLTQPCNEWECTFGVCVSNLAMTETQTLFDEPESKRRWEKTC